MTSNPERAEETARALLEHTHNDLRFLVGAYMEALTLKDPDAAERLLRQAAEQFGGIIHRAAQNAAHTAWDHGYSAGHHDALMGSRHPTPNPVPKPGQ